MRAQTLICSAEYIPARTTHMEGAEITQQGVLEWLAQQRRSGERVPAKVVRYGEWIIETGKSQALGDELWPFLEQVASAALELGNIELAEVRRC